jgi:hypothetical protein
MERFVTPPRAMKTEVKRVSLSRFVWSGAWIAGLIALVLGALAGLGYIAGIGVAPMLVLPLAGPMPRFLTVFDISDGQLRVLSVLAIVPYWFSLGGLAGWVCWSRCSMGRQPDQVDYRRCMWRLPVLVSALALLGGAIIFSSLARVPREHAPRNFIRNNLRQLDGAKQQYALDRSLSDGDVIGDADLAPYLKRSSPFPARAWNERYVLNPIGTEPFAIVESDYRVRRRGWREGYTVPAGTVVRLNAE